MTWNLTADQLAATRAKIEKIAVRAAKKGWNGTVAVEAVRKVVIEQLTTDDGQPIPGTEHEVTYWATTITGTAPCYEGWTFVAAIDWLESDEPVIRTAVGVEDDVDRDNLVPGACVCGKNRRRVSTYIVRNVETGEQVQVGSTCAKDFLGWDTKPVFLDGNGIREDIEDSFCGGDMTAPVEAILTAAVAAIRGFGGYIPVNAYDGTPTRDIVKAVLWPTNKGDDALSAGLDWKGSGKRAKAVRKFILSDDFAGDGTYVSNLKALCRLDWADAKHVGLLASAPQALARHEARETERVAREVKPSEWFGQEKEKITFTGEITNVAWSTSHFGYRQERTSTIYTIRAEDGRLVKWFASSPVLGEDTGVTVTITGTIKKHDEWNGIKSTILTRCKQVVATAA